MGGLMNTRSTLKLMLIVVLLALFLPGITHAISVSFVPIGNTSSNVALQLHLNIYNPTQALSQYGIALGTQEVLFAFTNTVGIESNIAEIYIDNGPLQSLVRVINNLTGTTSFNSFGGSVEPSNLPGGQLLIPAFEAVEILSVDSNNGSGKGVNSANDTLGIVYNLSGGLSAIQNDLDDGDLRIGLHVRSIGDINGQSLGFVNTSEQIPEPNTLLLLSTSLLSLATFYKRNM